MELDGFRALVALAEGGSIFSAARALSVSRITVRRRILSLSEELGVRLAEPTPTGLVLTEAGQRCAQDASKLLADYADLKETLRTDSEEVSGTVTIASPPGGAGRWTVPIAGALLSRYPELSLELVSGSDPVEAIEGGADIALCAELPERGRGLMVRSLGRVEVGLFASERYRARASLPTAPAELLDHPLVSGGVSGFRRVFPLWDGGLLQIEPRICTADAGAAIAAITLGVGVGLLVVHDAVGLVPVLPDEVGTDLPIFALFRAQRARLPRVKVVLETVSSFLKSVGQVEQAMGEL